jgi:DNA-3-methyladenine glycosylase II
VSLRNSLTRVGAVTRWRTPDLWDAIATAIIRQVIRADQARLLHHRFRAAYGRRVASPHGDAHLMPDAVMVANLPTEAFTSLGLSFKRRPLQDAAAAYLEQGAKWSELPPAQLVKELQTVPRIGPWTAGAAVADFSHDWTLYPYGDLAVRKWAAAAAPDVEWPNNEAGFAANWRKIAGDQLGPLTLFTLAWGASHGNSL